MAEVWQWPTFNYASANLFLTKKQRKELAKERWKGKAVRGTCSTRREEETKMTVVSNCAKDSAASFDIGPMSDPGTVRTQPMRVAKLHKHIVANASNSSNPDGTVSDSSCSSSSAASESRSRTDSDASTSAATPTSSSSNSSSESPFSVEPPMKKFCRHGTPSKPTVTWMTHPQAHPLQPYFAKVTITQPITLTVNHPKLGWGGANVGLQHLGRIPNCSEVPDTCVFCTF